jgi:hypothetical protein
MEGGTQLCPEQVKHLADVATGENSNHQSTNLVIPRKARNLLSLPMHDPIFPQRLRNTFIEAPAKGATAHPVAPAQPQPFLLRYS